MTHANPHRITVADLKPTRPTRVEITPDDDTLSALAAELGLIALRKLRLTGALKPEGKSDWRFDGHLGATVVQPCVVTLAPVTTRIEEDVTRRFLAHMPDLAGESGGGDEAGVEMPEDDSIEPLGPEIDLMALLHEALVLSLPLYPRDDGAGLDLAVFTEPGKAPMRDEDARPFAGLAGLRDKLTAGDNGGDNGDESGGDQGGN